MAPTDQKGNEAPSEKILERIRRLYAMSQDDSSPREAEIAMRRYEALKKQYGVTFAELKEREDTTHVGRSNGTTFKVLPEWAKWLGSAAGDITDTVSVLYSGGGRAWVAFHGIDEDHEEALMLFDYLCGVSKRALATYRKEFKAEHGVRLGHYEGVDFKIGFANTMARRAADIKRNRERGDGKALMILKQEMVLATLDLGEAKSKKTKRRVHHEAMLAGRKAALETKIAETVKG